MAYFAFTNFGIFPGDFEERPEREKLLMAAMMDRMARKIAK